MTMQMTSETLLCGLQLISPFKRPGKSEIRRGNDVVFAGTYRQCKVWAKKGGYLRSQAPSAK